MAAPGRQDDFTSFVSEAFAVAADVHWPRPESSDDAGSKFSSGATTENPLQCPSDADTSRVVTLEAVWRKLVLFPQGPLKLLRAL